MKIMRSMWVLVGLVLVSGCGLRTSFDFIEEVQLPTGEYIQIWREVKTEGYREIGGPGGWNPRYMSVEIISAQVMDKPAKWESEHGYVPILLARDPDNGEWTLIVTFYFCDAWQRLGKPKHPYGEFRFREGRWQRIDLQEQWYGHAANVMSGVSSKGEPALVSVPDEARRQRERPSAPEYRSIITNWPGC